MLRLGIVSLPLPVHDAAYGGNSLFWYWMAPTGPMPVGDQNDRDLFPRQRNLELLAGNKVANWRCALRQ
jgi:hypothetical protein